MTNRRGDAVYLLLFLVVALIGYQISTRTEEDRVAFPVDPTYRPPPLELPEFRVELPELPFALPSVGRESRSLGSHGLFSEGFFSDEMEAALARVRARLLVDAAARPRAVESAAHPPAEVSAQAAVEPGRRSPSPGGRARLRGEQLAAVYE